MSRMAQKDEGPTLGAETSARVPSLSSWLRIFAVQDLLMLAYLLVIWRLVWGATGRPDQAQCSRIIYVCLGIVTLGCWLARGTRALPHAVRWTIYRLALVGVLVENYLMLRLLLPLVRPDQLDEQLYQLDLDLFGVEPALWLERLNQRPIIEYFSFFYFSYFFICATDLIAVVLLSKGGRRTAELAVGTLFVFCVGQLGYMTVPAVGPVRYLAHQFHGPIDGGFFWGCVSRAVEAGSAMKDVFPSLHTAVPTWLTLFSYLQARTDPRWRWPARVVGFFAANIIFSTMLLRWHYAVDVIAGLGLAATARLITPGIVRWEERLRERHGLSLPWVFER
jgi:membrane-associated phospholipid phosphatase